MKRKGGVINNAYRLLLEIVTALDCAGHYCKNVYWCIGAVVVLFFSLIGSLVEKNHKIESLKRQKKRILLRLNREYENVEQELLEGKFLEIDCKNIQEEELSLLKRIVEEQDKYAQKEAAIIREGRARLCAYGIAFAILFVLNAGPIYTCAKELIDVIWREYEQETTRAESECGESVQVENKSADGFNGEDENDILEEIDESEDMESKGIFVDGMTFYLDDPALELIPTPEKLEAVFYQEQDNTDTAVIVKQHMKDLLDRNLKDTYNGYLSSAEERLADNASRQETIFDDSREMVKHYAAENNYARCLEKMQHSAVLDEIIKKRLALWEAQKRNSTIASLLANNYQDYALEYQNQGKNGYTILSYYIETIIWSELALSYEGANKEKIFRYIKARYWDIVTCRAIPEEYRNKAEKIYLDMGKYEDYIK